MKDFYIVGITGGIATGKSTVLRMLKNFGAPIINIDEISHLITKTDGKAQSRIQDCFGEDIYLNGELDRKKLGKIIFSDPDARKALEEILHPVIQRKVFEEIDKLKKEHDFVFLEVPLLFETGMDAMCQEVWSISTKTDLQRLRLMARSNLSADEANARIAAQMPQEEKDAKSDTVIYNNKDTKYLTNAVEKNYKSLLKRVETFYGKKL